jgi:tRNA pseudouridine38-40 synthase
MLFVLQYDGGAFAGWQRQANDRTVQADFESALERLLGHRAPVTGAGRTDTGVHALGQAAAAVVPERWEPGNLMRALNALLPSDIRVTETRRMVAGFNPRRHASERTYCYRIGTDDLAESPFRNRWEWATGPLDAALLAGEAAALAGTHAFVALSARGQEKPHYRCTVHEAIWQLREPESGLEFWITADRFLHRMVRFLVGTMVDVARGRRPAGTLASLLDTEDNQQASPPAPPHGLYLAHVTYPKECYA